MKSAIERALKRPGKVIRAGVRSRGEGAGVRGRLDARSSELESVVEVVRG